MKTQKTNFKSANTECADKQTEIGLIPEEKRKRCRQN